MGCATTMVAGQRPLPSTLYLPQRQDGAPSATTKCSTFNRHWLNPSARTNSNLSLKTHDPSTKGLRTTYSTESFPTQTLLLDLPPVHLSSAPIWRIPRAIYGNTSPTQSRRRRTSTGARFSLSTPCILSLCPRVVRLTQIH